jgi:hypothetical protein
VRHLLIVVTAVAVVCAAGMISADPPETMSYQGVLNDNAGVPVPDGTYSLEFRLYDVVTGGTALWSEVQSVLVEGGIFNVTLGSVVALTLPFDDSYWLAISVEGDPELAPRVALASAPYAFSTIRGDGDWEFTPVGGSIYRESGHVGIGTDTPTNKLHIHQDVNWVDMKLTNSSTGTGPGRGLYVDCSAGIAGLRTYYDDLDLILATGDSGTSTPRIWIESSGDVGIGTSSPDHALDVWGTAEVRGFVMPVGASSGHVLTSDAFGRGTWQPGGSGGGIDGSGTVSYIPKFTGTTTIGDSKMYESGGTVYVTPGAGPARGGALRSKEGGSVGVRLPSELYVEGENGWTVYAEVLETDTAADGRTALFAYRDRFTRNDGVGFAVDETNTAIKGYNYWGDSYTFGVAGYSYNDFEMTGGVLGSHVWGNYWGALGYKDDFGTPWGVYTPDDLYVGGDIVASSGAISGSEIANATITNVDVSPSANIADTKIAGTAWTHTDDGYPPEAVAAYQGGFLTTSSTYAIVDSAVITIPPASDGYIFAMANAYAGNYSGTYVAWAGLGFNSTAAEAYSERHFDITTGDNYECVTSSYMAHRASGTHTVYFVARRESGTGEVWFPRCSLSVMWIDQTDVSKGAPTEPVFVPSPETDVGR